ncbi:glycosyltransferase family 39 protein [Nostoc sp.]|uniref:glycosyltransferase family 39 protein n=1 Tax=Nostoc sp. TaxID=1180 RepID=UPI002FF5F4B2
MNIVDFSVLLICCLSFGFSCIESSVNLDSAHWGFMYVQALDLKRGLIPYQETFTIYGILTSWIQSLSLSLFGERMISIGIATGIFYSLSIFLSYQIFLKILPKYFAYFATLLIFLLHTYIIYPWSNYYSYTFLLLSILILFAVKKDISNMFFSGFFLGLSLLCRYSSVQATLLPFLLFLVYETLLKRDSKKANLSNALFFILGLLIPISLFLFFLIYHGVLNDFFIQNKIMLLESDQGVTVLTFIPILFNSIITSGGENALGDNPDSRIFSFTIIFFWNLVTLLYFLFQQLFLKKILTKDEVIVMAFCVITLFGYLNAIHIYEVFRLANSSSLGIGVIIYSIVKILPRLDRKIKIVMLLPLISICFIWANSLIFSETSSVYFPWKLDTLMGKEVIPTEISIFRGKILSKKYYQFYQEIFNEISKFDNSHYIVNYTLDSVAMAINNLPKVQMSSYYFPSIEQVYPKEAKRIQEVINAKKAVIISNKDIHIVGYKVIFSKPWSFAEVPWMGHDKSIYISVPEKT